MAKEKNIPPFFSFSDGGFIEAGHNKRLRATEDEPGPPLGPHVLNGPEAKIIMRRSQTLPGPVDADLAYFVEINPTIFEALELLIREDLAELHYEEIKLISIGATEPPVADILARLNVLLTPDLLVHVRGLARADSGRCDRFEQALENAERFSWRWYLLKIGREAELLEAAIRRLELSNKESSFQPIPPVTIRRLLEKGKRLGALVREAELSQAHKADALERKKSKKSLVDDPDGQRAEWNLQQALEAETRRKATRDKASEIWGMNPTLSVSEVARRVSERLEFSVSAETARKTIRDLKPPKRRWRIW